jgi:hypothetical protein
MISMADYRMCKNSPGSIKIVSEFVSNSVFQEYFYVSADTINNQSESYAHAQHLMDKLTMDEPFKTLQRFAGDCNTRSPPLIPSSG